MKTIHNIQIHTYIYFYIHIYMYIMYVHIYIHTYIYFLLDMGHRMIQVKTMHKNTFISKLLDVCSCAYF